VTGHPPKTAGTNSQKPPRHIDKPPPVSDAEAARIVTAIAKILTAPTPEDRNRLSPDWREAAHIATEGGEDGLKKWLEAVRTRDPEMAEQYATALAAPGVGSPPPWRRHRLGEPPAVGPFPLDSLPFPVRRFVTEGALSISGCSPDFLGLAVIVVAAIAIGRSVSLLLKPGWYEGVAIYAALVGEPGDGKSPAAAAASRPLWKIEHELYERWKVDHGRWKKGKEDEKGEEPILPRVVTSDATVEALAKILAMNPRGVGCLRDELSAWVGSMNQYKNGGKGSDRQFFLSAFSGEPVAVDRAKHANDEKIRIPHPFLAVLGAMTTSMLGELVEGKGRDDGFLDRLIFAAPDRAQRRGWVETGIDPETAGEWESIVRRLWTRPMEYRDGRDMPHVVQFSTSGRDAWKDWYNKHETELDQVDFPRSLKGPWAKMDRIMARLILILHMLDLSSGMMELPDPIPPIEPEVVHRAAGLVAYFKAHTRRVRAIIKGCDCDTSEDALSILAWIKRNKLSAFSESDLSRNLRSLREDEPRASALLWLIDRECIRPLPDPPRPPGQPGRKLSPHYEVNPSLVPKEAPEN
jgi:hypothetical protein